MWHRPLAVLFLTLIAGGCCSSLSVFRRVECPQDGIPRVGVSAHPPVISVGEAVVVVVTVTNPNRFPLRVKADSSKCLGYEVRDPEGGRVAFLKVWYLTNDKELKVGYNWDRSFVWTGSEVHPYFKLTPTPDPGDYTLLAGLWEDETSLVSDSASVTLRVLPGELFQREEGERQHKVLETGRELILSKFGKPFVRAYVGEPELRPLWGLVGTTWSREYQLRYQVSIPEKPFVEFQVELEFEGSDLVRSAGLPDCVTDLSRCEFAIDKERAVEIAREHGLAAGIEPWRISFRWSDDYHVPKALTVKDSTGPLQPPRFHKTHERREGYVWRIQNTLERTPPTARGETIEIDACDGLANGPRTWWTATVP